MLRENIDNYIEFKRISSERGDYFIVIKFVAFVFTFDLKLNLCHGCSKKLNSDYRKISASVLFSIHILDLFQSFMM